jgi:hypothetical protein
MRGVASPLPTIFSKEKHKKEGWQKMRAHARKNKSIIEHENTNAISLFLGKNRGVSSSCIWKVLFAQSTVIKIWQTLTLDLRKSYLCIDKVIPSIVLPDLITIIKD